MTDFSLEAIAYLQTEIPKLTDAEYNDLCMMLGSKSEEITLEQAESMIYVAKNPDEVEQIMYGNSTAKAVLGL